MLIALHNLSPLLGSEVPGIEKGAEENTRLQFT